MAGRYKVVRAFERWDGKALRKYTRGEVINAKDAAKMDIRDTLKYPRGSPLETLLASGAIYRMSDIEENMIVTDKTGTDKISDHSKPDLVTSPAGDIKTGMPVPEVA